MHPTDHSHQPASLPVVLGVTFLGSVSSGVFSAGMYFVTARHYAFSAERNLVLSVLMGAISAAGSRGAGRLAHGSAPRAVLLATLASWTALALVPVAFPTSEPMLWISAMLGALAASITWPVVESYLSAGRHGARMRAAIGWFNVTWTPATALPLVVMPILSRGGVMHIFGLSAATSLLALLIARRLPRRPSAHEPEAASAAVGPEYVWLRRSTFWLLPLSYVVSTTLGPVLPYRLAAVGIVGAWPSAIAALWMAARFTTLLTMWRTGFWHGRWGTLAASACALAVGLALVLLGRTPAAVVAGLLIFGAGMGLTYYAALYYTLAVGRAAVEAGGTFEALIGLGSCVGPALGFAGHAMSSPAHAGATTIALIAVLAALITPRTIGPYLAARRQRRTRSP